MLVVLFVDPGVHVVAAMPATQTGVASGMNANIRTLGGAVGSALTASIVTATVLSSGLPTELGYGTPSG